ncbi:hypothetical protein GGS20DRAFT_584964 [Poronia punctata]|nr:hypothetical protein GGS20DRAFT_584964 [Poronia punctata]
MDYRTTSAFPPTLPELPVLPTQRRWDVTKAVFRALSILIAFAAIVTLAYLQATGAPPRHELKAGFPVLVVILIWDVAEFAVIFTYRNISRGIPISVQVGVELVLWLGCIATLTLLGLYGTFAGVSLESQSAWSQLSFAQLFRFILFVRVCVEVDRRRRDRRVQALVYALQTQGRNPQDYPLEAFKAAQDIDYSSSTMLAAITGSPPASNNDKPSYLPTPLLERPRSAPEERDSRHKYNFQATNIPEFRGSAIHPEEARNQKVLVGAFPR